ncbi:MAG: hypothetical protein GF375_03425, partial [Candidatus Omnitrophica bacterium]|nr:hypothetical protein [Candidatus Omnitrophota bacterium]MBD3269125.1 hypothetical protein [Candidatus Omnitrophota bacterium]
MDKERKKALRRRAGWYAIKIFTDLSGKLPLSTVYIIGKLLGRLTYFLVLPQRRIALQGLAIAFPQKTPMERKVIARDFFIFMAQSSLELLHILKNEDELQRVRIRGEEYLKDALSKKKGVVIFTAHFGNFPLMSLKLAKKGYKANIVARPMRDKKAGDHFHELREKAGVKTIFSYPRKECVNGIIKALRNNEIVIIQMDQNFGTGGVWIKFFNKLAATPVGPIIFALRTGASTVPAYIYRTGEGRHSLEIMPGRELT